MLHRIAVARRDERWFESMGISVCFDLRSAQVIVNFQGRRAVKALRAGFLQVMFLGAMLVLVSSRPASTASCGAGPVASAEALVQCIRERPLLDHLVALQQIADQNPGSDGHGSRDTGTSGYKASVDYIARLMRGAGYRVTIQPYHYTAFGLTAAPRFSLDERPFVYEQEWHVARMSGSGTVVAPVQAVSARTASERGCAPADFRGFVPGSIALIERSSCDLDDQVKDAEDAHAAAVIIYRGAGRGEPTPKRGESVSNGAYPAQLAHEARIPVVAVASHAVGAELLRRGQAGPALVVHIDIQAQTAANAIDYNLIADSPYGDSTQVVVVEAHLDSIYGAGILDNATGSSSILEIALNMARTPTRRQLRFIWFGGEEIGLLGSAYYTKNLPPRELAKIVFDVDADVTATPNYAVLIADPGHASNVRRFPANVVPDSQRGNQYFADYFASIGVPSKIASFGNDGTDSNSFSVLGIPNTGVLTQQNCCKTRAEVALWGGVRGNYEGKVPSRNGGCVDRSHRWCDDIDNVAPAVFEFVSRSVAYVSYQLANDGGR